MSSHPVVTSGIGVSGATVAFSYPNFIGGAAGTLTCFWILLQIWQWFEARKKK